MASDELNRLNLFQLFHLLATVPADDVGAGDALVYEIKRRADGRRLLLHLGCWECTTAAPVDYFELVALFSVPDIIAVSRRVDPMPTSLPTILEAARTDRPHPVQNFPACLSEFRDRFSKLSLGLLDGMLCSGCVVAGGAVFRCLMPWDTDEKMGQFDLDLFLFNSWESAKAIAYFYGKFGSCVKKLHPGASVTFVDSATAVTFVCNVPGVPDVQVVLRQFRCLERALLSFDLDCCRVAFDGKEVLCLPQFVLALATRSNVLDCGLNTLVVDRVVKYVKRGFRAQPPAYVYGLCDEAGVAHPDVTTVGFATYVSAKVQRPQLEFGEDDTLTNELGSIYFSTTQNSGQSIPHNTVDIMRRAFPSGRQIQARFLTAGVGQIPNYGVLGDVQMMQNPSMMGCGCSDCLPIACLPVLPKSLVLPLCGNGPDSVLQPLISKPFSLAGQQFRSLVYYDAAWYVLFSWLGPEEGYPMECVVTLQWSTGQVCHRFTQKCCCLRLLLAEPASATSIPQNGMELQLVHNDCSLTVSECSKLPLPYLWSPGMHRKFPESQRARIRAFVLGVSRKSLIIPDLLLLVLQLLELNPRRHHEAEQAIPNKWNQFITFELTVTTCEFL